MLSSEGGSIIPEPVIVAIFDVFGSSLGSRWERCIPAAVHSVDHTWREISHSNTYARGRVQ